MPSLFAVRLLVADRSRAGTLFAPILLVRSLQCSFPGSATMRPYCHCGEGAARIHRCDCRSESAGKVESGGMSGQPFATLCA
jgi:hypothetical protein